MQFFFRVSQILGNVRKKATNIIINTKLGGNFITLGVGFTPRTSHITPVYINIQVSKP